jgi:acetoin utilization protein AcuB
MVVRDYMSRNVTTLNDDARLLDAALLIRRTGKRHLPIINASGTVVGILSDRDVSRLAPSMLGPITPEEYNNIFEATPVVAAMTKGPITVSPDTPVQDAVALLYSRKIGALPVVENGSLVGILTVADMLGLLNELLCGDAAPKDLEAGQTAG